MTTPESAPDRSPVSVPVPSVPPADDTAVPPWVRRAIALLLAGVVLLFVGRLLLVELRGLIVAVLVALFLSFAMEPAVDALAARGWRRGRATGLVMGAFSAAVVVFLVAVGSLLVDQAVTLADRAPEDVEELVASINDTFGTNLEAQDLIDRINELGLPERLAGGTWTLTTTVLGGMLTLFTVLLFTFYLTADGPRLRRSVCSVLPPARQREVLRIWEVAVDKTGGYLYSRVILAVLSSLFTAIALWVIGVPSPVALALWVGLVSQFLPVVGTYLAGVLPVAVALVNSPIDAAWVLVFVVVYQQVENYVFAPRITARTMELHPAVAFAAVLAGGALLGAAGALLALPAVASVQAIVSSSVDRTEVIDSPMLDERPQRRRFRRRARRLGQGVSSTSPPG